MNLYKMNGQWGATPVELYIGAENIEDAFKIWHRGTEEKLGFKASRNPYNITVITENLYLKSEE